MFPEYEIFVSRNLSFVVRIFLWRLPSDHGIFKNNSASFNNVTFQHLFHPLILFSTSVELESDNVCLSVRKYLGQPRDPINGQILLKFGTLVSWVHTWGCLFSCFKNFHFWALWTIFSQNEAKTLWKPREPKNGWSYLGTTFWL